MTLDEITQAAAAVHLVPLGGVHDDDGTVVLLGPKEPGFWGYVTAQPAFKMATSDPLDHWSEQAVAGIAQVLGAVALFPFGGPPFHPFIAWALDSGQAWKSPVGLLVHADAGLLVSYRGALRFDHRIDLWKNALSPCDSCVAKPCVTACPVSALGPDGYDVAACKAHIDVDPVCGAGCRVRMACPVSRAYPRAPAQTAFHMKAFHPT